MSEIDVITDYTAWPDNGEAPLLVSLLVNVSTRDQVRRIWTLENGKEKQEELYPEPIQHEYKTPGTFNDEIEIILLKQGSVSGGKRKFPVTVKPSEEHPLIRRVDDSVKGVTYQNTKIKFTVLPNGFNAGNVEEMTWHFENESVNEPWDKGSFDKNHTYSSPGKYTEKVTIKTKEGVEDSKLFYILVLPKI